MPGQSAANRTPLMPLLASTFRSVLGPPPLMQEGALGTFSYVGTNWPDVGKLGTDDQYGLFLIIGLILQCLFVFSAYLYCSSFLDQRIVSVALLSFPLNPFFLSQSIFLWPKLSAAFFILLCAYTLQIRKSYPLAAFLLGMAYYCHPLVLLFFPGYGLFVLLAWRKGQIRFSELRNFFGVLGLTLVPWLAWTKLIVRLKADLGTQNYLIFEPISPWVNFIYVRVVSLFDTFIPTGLGNYPFNFFAFLRQADTTVPGAVGLFLFPFACFGFLRGWRQFRNPVLCFLVLPTACICLIFSIPTPFTIHGLQAVVPVLIVFGLDQLRRVSNRRWLLTTWTAVLGFNI